MVLLLNITVICVKYIFTLPGYPFLKYKDSSSDTGSVISNISPFSSFNTQFGHNRVKIKNRNTRQYNRNNYDDMSFQNDDTPQYFDECDNAKFYTEPETNNRTFCTFSLDSAEIKYNAPEFPTSLFNEQNFPIIEHDIQTEQAIILEEYKKKIQESDSKYKVEFCIRLNASEVEIGKKLIKKLIDSFFNNENQISFKDAISKFNEKCNNPHTIIFTNTNTPILSDILGLISIKHNMYNKLLFKQLNSRILLKEEFEYIVESYYKALHAFIDDKLLYTYDKIVNEHDSKVADQYYNALYEFDEAYNKISYEIMEVIFDSTEKSISNYTEKMDIYFPEMSASIFNRLSYWIKIGCFNIALYSKKCGNFLRDLYNNLIVEN